MKKNENEAKALFRYGLISEFLHGGLSRGQQSARMEELAAREYAVSWRKVPLRISVSSLKRWLSRYRRYGLKGLAHRPRADRHVSKAIDPVVSERVIAVKKSDPFLSIPLLIRSLEDNGECPRGSLKHSTVHRLLQRHGLSGRVGRDRGMKRQRLPYRYALPMQLWVGDVMHSEHEVQGRKAYLIAWMDNASRAIMHAEYRHSESSLDILTTFRQALEVRGICKRVYVDHGSGYVDSRFVRTCAHLGIHLQFAPVRDGAAKGCIERWFLVVRTGFERHLVPDDLGSLDILNSLLWRWIHSTYHPQSHSGLSGDSPWQRFLTGLSQIDHRRVEPGFDFPALWKTRLDRTVHRDGTVRLQGHILEIPPTVTRSVVELRFMDEALPQDVEVWEGEILRGPGIPVELERNTRRRRWRPQSTDHSTSRSLVDPLTRARNVWETSKGDRS